MPLYLTSCKLIILQGSNLRFTLWLWHHSAFKYQWRQHGKYEGRLFVQDCQQVTLFKSSWLLIFKPFSRLRTPPTHTRAQKRKADKQPFFIVHKYTRAKANLEHWLCRTFGLANWIEHWYLVCGIPSTSTKSWNIFLG